MRYEMNVWRVALLVACTVLGGCVSPEAKRTRGGGPGADTGNRPRIVKMHEGSQPFWKTPVRIGDESEHPPLESARQAQEMSR